MAKYTQDNVDESRVMNDTPYSSSPVEIFTACNATYAVGEMSGAVKARAKNRLSCAQMSRSNRP